jgi:membrane-associated phospholipid phosphatase
MLGTLAVSPAALGALVTISAANALAAQQADSVRPAPIVMWRDVGILGGGVVLATIVQRADITAQREVRRSGWQENAALDAISDVTNPWGAPGVVIASVGLWGVGRVAHRPVVAAAGFRAFEAITVSGWITQSAKDMIGRARPRVNPNDAWDVEWWRGHGSENGDYESMPSGHATAAFAFAAAVTSELAWRDHPQTKLVGITTYSLAAMTGYARMHVDAHWFSDVTMGAAVGIASGLAVTRWHNTRPGNRLDHYVLGTPMAPRISPLIAPGPDGSTLLGATITWR